MKNPVGILKTGTNILTLYEVSGLNIKRIITMSNHLERNIPITKEHINLLSKWLRPSTVFYGYLTDDDRTLIECIVRDYIYSSKGDFHICKVEQEVCNRIRSTYLEYLRNEKG